jgi:phosphate transport system protein
VSEDLRQSFHEDLYKLDQLLAQLMSNVAASTAQATEAFLTNDVGTAVVLVGFRDLTVPAYAEIEAKVEALVARQAPVARDLRYLLAVFSVVREIELSANLAADIARRGSQDLAGQISGRARTLISRLGRVVNAMWEQILGFWQARRSTSNGLETLVDEHDELLKALIAEIAASEWPTPVTMELTLVARFYERLGDHAVDIGRRLDQLVGVGQGS